MNKWKTQKVETFDERVSRKELTSALTIRLYSKWGSYGVMRAINILKLNASTRPQYIRDNARANGVSITPQRLRDVKRLSRRYSQSPISSDKPFSANGWGFIQHHGKYRGGWAQYA